MSWGYARKAYFQRQKGPGTNIDGPESQMDLFPCATAESELSNLKALIQGHREHVRGPASKIT